MSEIGINLPSDVIIYEGSPPQDTSTFDKPIGLGNHNPNINYCYDSEDGDSSSNDDDAATDE